MENEPKGMPVDLRSCALVAEKRGELEVADRLRAAACVVEGALSREKEALKQAQEAKHAMACMAASRDRWKMEAQKGAAIHAVPALSSRDEP